LSDIDGVVEFLTLCHIGILFNVLDRRSYPTRGQTEMASLRMEQYDDNTIPKEDRRRIVYGRGLALELIRWLDSRYILQKAEEDEENSSHPSGNVDDEENIMTIQDFELHYLIRQGICIATYNKQWLQEQEERADGGMDVDEAEVDDAQEQEEDEGYKQKEVPIPSSALEQQLKWAMTAVPWMNDTWGKFSKDLEAESSEGSHDMDMRCQGTKKFNPVRRPAPDPSYQPWSEAFVFSILNDRELTKSIRLPGDLR
jgi:bifunctional DNA-binding transcriptional regulator/antitoxin component of YhaV-PrlF toxin-antitoxin module